MGSSLTNSISRGYSWAASRVFHQAVLDFSRPDAIARAGDADAVFGNQMEGLFRVEFFGSMRQHRYTVVPAGKQHINQPADPGPVRRGPEKITFLRKKIVGEFDARQVPQKRPVDMQRTFGRTGGTGSVIDTTRSKSASGI